MTAVRPLVLVALAGFLDYLALGSVVAGAALVVGLILAVTGYVQQCPLNSLLGLNTCRGSRR